ncbi:MAG: GMC family oxidoreductase [Candidatus Thiodiazotropha endolucinida]|nr:GMC family oxidoreductase [Candidatus Thiodiazotropha taylori]MCW4316742.1 GMC family oxidoreductase [Candidatus Thiodiazotropha taylori]
MTVNQTGIKLVSPEVVSNNNYDVVVVGAGIAGAIVAKQLSKEGKSVLIVEAGTAEGLNIDGFYSYVRNYHRAVSKHSNSPYPINNNAVSPTDGIRGYFEEKGPFPISGSYTRITGGTTMHWEGKTLRMLPEDFELKTKYGVGLDWPISYDDLQPYYSMAEYEIGVSGDLDEQKELGIPFEYNYNFPMKKIPPSYLDERVREGIDGTSVKMGGTSIELKLSTFPQGRNGEVNPNITYQSGAKCQGNGSCVPICPYQAKYDARRTLNSIPSSNQVHLLPQAVASKVEVDADSGRVLSIQYKHYVDKDSPEHSVNSVKGKVYVLAANAVENARLMLASNLKSTSGLMGKNLMDHPFLLAWGLMPEPAGAMRGPLVTSGLGVFRNGEFRANLAAFGMDIHNDGWGWSGTGVSDVVRSSVNNNFYGKILRRELVDKISKQILLAFMLELPADPNNQITVDPQYTDQLGNLRPVVHFDLPEYCKKSIAYTRELSRSIFDRIGAEDHTHYDESDPSYFEFNGEGYWFRGGNHFSGTHIMGTHKSNSVVNEQLRCWDHDNLYMLGSGSMPSIGSANTSLSIAALSYRAAKQLLSVLRD